MAVNAVYPISKPDERAGRTPSSAAVAAPADDWTSVPTAGARGAAAASDDAPGAELLVDHGDVGGGVGGGDSGFDSLGLDARIVAKLLAPPGDATKAAPPLPPAGAAVPPVISTAASGIARGHFRDGFGLTRPTRVQRLVLPRAIAGRSLLVKSETGSGKTLAFLLPILQGLLQGGGGAAGLPEAAGGSAGAAAAGSSTAFAAHRAAGTRAIVLAPTRELCQQIFTVATRLLQVRSVRVVEEAREIDRYHSVTSTAPLLQPFPWLVPGIVAGGEKRKSEKARLRRGVTVLVATPGRLCDHLRSTEAFRTAELGWLVLDEADRLLDLGFGAQLADIMRLLRGGRPQPPPALAQRVPGGAAAAAATAATSGVAGAANAAATPWRTFLLSATMNPSVRALARTVIGGGQTAWVLDATLTGALRGGGGGGGMAAPAAAAVAADAALDDDDEEEEEEEKGGGGAGGNPAAGAGGPHRELAPAGACALSHRSPAFPYDPMLRASPPPPCAGSLVAPSQLTQQFMAVPLKWRLVTVLALAFDAAVRGYRAAALHASRRASTGDGSGPRGGVGSRSGGGKMLVFMSSCDAVDFHYHLLKWLMPAMLAGGSATLGAARRGAAPLSESDAARLCASACPVHRLHGGIPQAERTLTFRAFAAAECGILITTDVAARGLDLPAVDGILQVDPPSDSLDYVHRVGRTARRCVWGGEE